jgi:hypothetical protein
MVNFLNPLEIRLNGLLLGNLGSIKTCDVGIHSTAVLFFSSVGSRFPYDIKISDGTTHFENLCTPN